MILNSGKVDINLTYLNSNKSIYIWNNTFDDFSEVLVNAALVHYSIEKYLLSASSDINIIEYFRNKQKKNKFELIMLCGYNSWIYSENYDSIDDKLNQLFALGITKIHLDVEPHTIDELKDNRELYLKMYLSMLKYIKSNHPDFEIEISIPTFYSIEYVLKFSEFVTNIYLMAYEYNSIETLVNRVKPFEKLYSKLTLVFNCIEFNTLDDLTNDLFEFRKCINLNQIAFHNFKTFSNIII